MGGVSIRIFCAFMILLIINSNLLLVNCEEAETDKLTAHSEQFTTITDITLSVSQKNVAIGDELTIFVTYSRVVGNQSSNSSQVYDLIVEILNCIPELVSYDPPYSSGDHSVYTNGYGYKILWGFPIEGDAFPSPTIFSATFRITGFSSIKPLIKAYNFGIASAETHIWLETKIPTFQLTVKNSEGGGLTDPIPATYTFHQVATVTMTANPSTEWKFDHWLLDDTDIGDTNPYQVNINANHTIQAVFTPDNAQKLPYVLTVLPIEGQGATDPVPTTYSYYQAVTVWVKATPSQGWVFNHWELDGTNIGDENPYLVNMNANHNIKAFFVKENIEPERGIPGFSIEAVLFGLIIFLLFTRKTAHMSVYQ